MGPYHSGEREAQQRAGVCELADRVGRIIGPTIPAAAAVFLTQRTFVVAATVSAGGTVHASILGGSVGFITVPDPSTVMLRPESGDRATVSEDLQACGTIGLLAIDFATRRRMRANGTGRAGDGTIAVSTREVYSNCPQYIHPRQEPSLTSVPESRTPRLSERQMAFVSAADTFFIASSHPERGADASHRGGDPGFVSVTPESVSWLDFPGNNMFNTLGNLLIDERCSLLFADFQSGEVLRLDGRAAVDWGEPRRIHVSVDEVVAGFR